MSQFIIVRHATPRANVKSILRTGIDPHKRTGKMLASWFHTPGRSAWAILHVSKRHQVPVEDICLITLKIRRSWLRHWTAGIWTCGIIVPPSHIISVNPWASAA